MSNTFTPGELRSFKTGGWRGLAKGASQASTPQTMGKNKSRRASHSQAMMMEVNSKTAAAGVAPEASHEEEAKMAKRKSTPTIELTSTPEEVAAILEKAESATPYEPVKANGKVSKPKGAQKSGDAQLKKLLEEASPLRLCVCGCGRRFRPQLSLSNKTTELYATPDCAAGALRKKGLLPVVSPEKAAAAASKAEKKVEVVKQATARLAAVRTPRAVDPDAAAAHMDLKYGPWVLITKIVSVYGDKQHLAKIEMACGHKMSWYNNGFPGSKKGAAEGNFLARCIGCRPKPIVGA